MHPYSLDLGDYRVSKLALVSVIDAALNTGALQIDGNLPETKILIAELQDFRSKRTAAGNETFNARSGRHDDLVLATALPLWHAVAVGNQTLGVGTCIWG
jgi:hypothetical protein